MCMCRAPLLSMTVYTVMAVASAVALIWRIKVGHAVAAAAAPIGASFTLLALVTGSLMGPADVGHLLGLGPAADVRTHLVVSVRGRDVAALGLRGSGARRSGRGAAGHRRRASMCPSFTSRWCGGTRCTRAPRLLRLGAPKMPGSMLWPLLSMWLGFMLFFGAVLCIRLRGEVLNRERQSAWVREAVKS